MGRRTFWKISNREFPAAWRSVFQLFNPHLSVLDDDEDELTMSTRHQLDCCHWLLLLTMTLSIIYIRQDTFQRKLENYCILAWRKRGMSHSLEGYFAAMKVDVPLGVPSGRCVAIPEMKSHSTWVLLVRKGLLCRFAAIYGMLQALSFNFF